MLSARDQQRWLMVFMIVGLALRVTRYLLCFPLWEDEAMLSANLLKRGYLELLEPLHYCQAAPALFLWGQLTLVKLFGFHEYSLRLPALLSSLASLWLFRHVAGRLLQGISLVLAVGLFAVAYPITRYAAEAKPYGSDLLLSLVMLALVIEWLRHPGETRWLWYLAAMVVPAMGYSFPTVFVGGGMSVVVAMALWRQRRRGWRPWLVYNVLLLASFLGLLILSNHAVPPDLKELFDRFFADSYPPLSNPLALIAWLVRVHAGSMLSYPVGGPNWGSVLSFVCFVAGLAVLVRRRQWLLSLLLLAPLGLNLAAAAMHRFPYGGHPRMTFFAAPAFCTLIGLGTTAILAWHENRRLRAGRPSKHLALVAVLAGLVVLAGTGWVRDVVHPYKSATTLRAREFARWFWFVAAHDSEVIFCDTDLQTDLMPEKLNCGYSSLYFCNQRIYSPRRVGRIEPAGPEGEEKRPRRYVFYYSPREEGDGPSANSRAKQRLLDEMPAGYNLVSRERYPFPAYDKSDRKALCEDYIEIFKFEPCGSATTAAAAEGTQTEAQGRKPRPLHGNP